MLQNDNLPSKIMKIPYEIIYCYFNIAEDALVSPLSSPPRGASDTSYLCNFSDL